MATKKVMITCDSVCDLSKKLISKYKVKVLPIQILVGDTEYVDNGSLTSEDIYKKYREDGILPKTAAFSPQTAIDFFKPYTDKGYEIVHIDLSSELSSCYQNANIATLTFDNVYIVDSRQLSTGMGLLVIEACKLRDRGFSAKEIAEQLEIFKNKISASFVVDTLEFLHKGGRCSNLTVMGANMLSLRPCLEMKDGTLKVTKKYRGKIERVYSQYLTDKLDVLTIDTTREVFITHSGEVDKKTLNELKNRVSETLKTEDVYITQAGSTVCSHCGPKTLGILYVNK